MVQGEKGEQALNELVAILASLLCAVVVGFLLLWLLSGGIGRFTK